MRVWSVECEVGESGVCRMWSVERGVWSVERGVWREGKGDGCVLKGRREGTVSGGVN